MHRPGNIQSFLTPRGKMVYSLDQYPRGQWVIQVQRPGLIQSTIIASQVKRNAKVLAGYGISDQAAGGILTSYQMDRMGGGGGKKTAKRFGISDQAAGGSLSSYLRAPQGSSGAGYLKKTARFGGVPLEQISLNFQKFTAAQPHIGPSEYLKKTAKGLGEAVIESCSSLLGLGESIFMKLTASPSEFLKKTAGRR